MHSPRLAALPKLPARRAYGRAERRERENVSDNSPRQTRAGRACWGRGPRRPLTDKASSGKSLMKQPIDRRIWIPAMLASCVSVLPLGRAEAAADDLFNRYFANVLDGPPCFARTYNAAYLQAHSDQRVRSIEID